MESSRWWAIAIAAAVAVALGHSQAHAAPCPPSAPACHLENGKALLRSDPKQAAAELLASFQLDERTDTLALYATALQLDHQYALALETWKRVIVFRDSELDAAKQAAAAAAGRKRAAARAAEALAEKQSEEAAGAILALWPKVGRVRIRGLAGEPIAVSRGGSEIDASHEVLVNAGHDELVFTRKDGSASRVVVVVEVAVGAVATIDAPAARSDATVARLLAPMAKPERPVSAAAKPTSPAVAASDADEAPRLQQAPRSPIMSRVGLGTIAAGVLAGGTAAGLAYVAGHDRDDAFGRGCSGDGHCPAGPAAELAQRANDRTRLAQISAVGAGVLAATGATLWLVGRAKPHAVTDLALHIGPSSTVISGRF